MPKVTKCMAQVPDINTLAAAVGIAPITDEAYLK
jgi:hypothetical protein